MAAILSGMTVLDLTQNIAGPYCTQLLGDLGANVIKVEKQLVGDDTRQWGDESSKQGESAAFMAVNRNKKSICIDLRHPEGIELVYDLAKEADIFIHSMKPTTAEAKGLGYEQISKINPKIIYGAISAFGEIGPMKTLPGYDPLIQAYTGIMSVTGNPGDDPARVGISLMDMGSGMWLTIGVLAALHDRNNTGKGSKVSNSLLETGVAWGSLQLASYMETGKVPTKIGTAMSLIAPYEAFKTSDGWVMIAAGNNHLFRNLCSTLDISELAENPKFLANPERVKNRHDLHSLIEEQTEKYTVAELVHHLREGNVPCSPINTLDRVYSDEQVNTLELIKKVEHSRVDDFKIVDIPISINNQRSNLQFVPPMLSEHSEEILKEFGYSDQDITQLRADKIIE